MAGFLARLLARLQQRRDPRPGISQADYASFPSRVALCDARFNSAPEQLEIASFPPLHLSVLILGEDPTGSATNATLASLDRQISGTWEAFATGPLPEVAPAPNIHLIPENTSDPATVANTAIGMATGGWCAILAPGDRLPRDALLRLAEALNRFSEAGLIYADEDRIDEKGRRSAPQFKPVFNPELLWGRNYLTGLCAMRLDHLRAVGGYRPEARGAEAHDLALRITARLSPSQIIHIPRVLCHRAETPQPDPVADRRVVAEHLARVGIAADVLAHPAFPSAPVNRVVIHPPADPPLVSILIPTRDRLDLLRPCIESLFARTTYPNLEVLIADNGSDEPETLAYLNTLAQTRANVTILRCDYPFNYPRLSNEMADAARGAFLVLMNNDVEVQSRDWIQQMLGLAALPGRGCVGARLLFPDGRVQHAGVVLGVGYGADHMPALIAGDDPGHLGAATLLRRVSAVTAAVLMLRKSLYHEVGGMDARNLPVAWNDIDLCLKVARQGYANVWAPQAEFTHHESASRGHDETAEKVASFLAARDFMSRKWALDTTPDPYYNPNLGDTYPGYCLAPIPRDLHARAAPEFLKEEQLLRGDGK